MSVFVDLPCESCPCRCRVVRVAEARIWILDPNNGIRDCSSNCCYHGYHDEDDCKNGNHEDGNNNACCLLASLPCVPSPSLAGLALPGLAFPCLALPCLACFLAATTWVYCSVTIATAIQLQQQNLERGRGLEDEDDDDDDNNNSSMDTTGVQTYWANLARQKLWLTRLRPWCW